MTMTRAEIEESYDVDSHGVIRSPGKFEGEMMYVPYFWDIYLDGGARDDEDGVLIFEIDDTDRALFPELTGVKTVRLVEDGNGFVCEVNQSLRTVSR